MKKLGVAGVIALMVVSFVVGIAVHGQESVSLDAAFGVRMIEKLTESAISALVDGMNVMTATANMRTGDWDQMEDLLAQFEESELSYNAWFLKTDGSYYKVGTGLASANLSDRDYFPTVMGGNATLGDLVVSRSTGRKSMILTAPVFNGPSVIGALGVTLYLDDFSAYLASKLNLPEGLSFYGYDKNAMVICVHPDASLLLEPEASSGISMAAGGHEISDLLGWGFILGTTP